MATEVRNQYRDYIDSCSSWMVILVMRKETRHHDSVEPALSEDGHHEGR